MPSTKALEKLAAEIHSIRCILSKHSYTFIDSQVSQEAQGIMEPDYHCEYLDSTECYDTNNIDDQQCLPSVRAFSPDWHHKITVVTIVVLLLLLLLTFAKPPIRAGSTWTSETVNVALISPSTSYFVHRWLENNEPIKTRHFSWSITEKTFSPTNRTVLAINGQVPGPTIEAIQYDNISVHVQNKMDIPSTLHFHGLSQFDSNNQDGVPFVTQYYILPGEDFFYEFQATDSGTFWWHAHYASSRLDGLFGAMIIHPRATHAHKHALSFEQQILQNATDFVVLVGDWYKQFSNLYVSGYLSGSNHNLLEPTPDSIQVNGQIGPGSMPYQFVLPKRLQQERYWRLRLINVGAIAEVRVSAPIRSGGMMVLEADSTMVKPVQVDALTLAVGQRYSILIDTDDYGSSESVIIEFELDISTHNHHGTPHDTSKPISNSEQLAAAIYHVGQSEIEHDINGTHRQAGMIMEKDERSNQSLKVNALVRLHDGMLHPHQESEQRLLQPMTDLKDVNLVTLVLGTAQINGSLRSTINGHAYVQATLPRSRITSERIDALVPYESALSANYSDDGVTLRLNQGQDVFILFRNENGGAHPMHIHGHQMQLLATDTFFYDPLNPDVRPSRPFNADALASILQNETDGKGVGIWRDTVNVASNGWSLVRVRAAGKGLWAIHCHIVWHEISGMMMIMKVS